MGAKLIQVIETDNLRGKGTAEEPFRRVMQYYTPEGELLAERDDSLPSDTLTKAEAEELRAQWERRFIGIR
jgi:hypothetical protein